MLRRYVNESNGVPELEELREEKPVWNRIQQGRTNLNIYPARR